MSKGIVEIFTDGSALGNPGRGAYAAILRYKGISKEIAQAYANTTNNRMELMAVIAALSKLKRRSKLKVFSDSRYICDAINKNWLKNWRARSWRKSDKKKPANLDLWQNLANLLDEHDAEFVWVEGHAGHPENERCDQLAKERAKKGDWLVDKGYIKSP